MTPDVQALIDRADAESALLERNFDARWDARLARWEEERQRDLRILWQCAEILDRAAKC